MIPEKLFLDQAEKINLITKRVTLDQLETETEKFCQNLVDKPMNILLPIKGMLNYLHMHQLERFFSKEREVIDLALKNDFSAILSYFEDLWKKI